MKNLRNHFLVSMPHINDPVFKQSLIYICSHDKMGAMGLIINKPISMLNMKIELDSIIEQTDLSKISPKLKVYFGGPVGLDLGIILHGLDYKTNKTIKISSEIGVTSDSRIIEDIIKGDGPRSFRFSMGYAGWDNGQLEEEFNNGDWLVFPGNSELIFNFQEEMKWKDITSKLGINISDFSGNTGFA